MKELRIQVSDEAAQAALKVAPEVISRNVDQHLERGAHEVAREAVAILGENKSMARSLLALSILSGVRRAAPMHFTVTAGTNYARAVEEGTGPAAGRKAYTPNSTHLLDYVKQRARITFKGARGSAQRRSQMQELRDRAFALAMHIRAHGTKPHPYMVPALERKTSRLQQLVRFGAHAGVAELSGGNS